MIAIFVEYKCYMCSSFFTESSGLYINTNLSLCLPSLTTFKHCQDLKILSCAPGICFSAEWKYQAFLIMIILKQQSIVCCSDSLIFCGTTVRQHCLKTCLLCIEEGPVISSMQMVLHNYTNCQSSCLSQ